MQKQHLLSYVDSTCSWCKKMSAKWDYCVPISILLFMWQRCKISGRTWSCNRVTTTRTTYIICAKFLNYTTDNLSIYPSPTSCLVTSTSPTASMLSLATGFPVPSRLFSYGENHEGQFGTECCESIFAKANRPRRTFPRGIMSSCFPTKSSGLSSAPMFIWSPLEDFLGLTTQTNKFQSCTKRVGSK